MNKLTTINTIKKAAPLALLAVVMSGSAFAGPKGDRPAKAKLSIDVENECVLEGTDLKIYTTVKPSGSKLSDPGDILQPVAVSAFKVPDCTFNPSGKKQTCSNKFQPAGDDYTMTGSQPDFYTKIELCKENPQLVYESAVNAFITVPVLYDDPDGELGTGDEVITELTSSCDDIAKEGIYPEGDFKWFDYNGNGYVDDGEMVDVVDQSNIELHFDEDPCVPPTPL
jgi:hypothetical protein